MSREPQLTPQVVAVLETMLEDPAEPWYGFELCKEAGLRSGTIYPLLARLERAGWLKSSWEELDPSEAGRPPRRLYRLTGEGERAARAGIERLASRLLRARTAARRGLPKVEPT